MDTAEDLDHALTSGVHVLAPHDVLTEYGLTDTERTPTRKISSTGPTGATRRGSVRPRTPQAGSSGVCGPGCEVEQSPVPVALEEFIEPLREPPRGLRILVGAGEHPGPREDFAAGVLFALRGRSTGTESARGGFTELWRRKRLDLTVEALVVQSKWDELFSDEERQIALSRSARLRNGCLTVVTLPTRKGFR